MTSQTQFGLLLISTILLLGVTVSPAYSQDSQVLDSLIVRGDPTANDIATTVVQGEEGTISFDDFISDLKDDDATLVVTVNTTGTGVSSPKTGDSLGDGTGGGSGNGGRGGGLGTGPQTAHFQLDFNSEDITTLTIPPVEGFTVTSTDNTLRVTPLFYADIGDFELPYRVTDSDGNRDEGVITITVTVRTNAVPTVTPITATTSGTTNVDIDFYTAISDDIGVDDNAGIDENLTVTFSFTDSTHNLFFTPSGLTADASDDYILDTNPVTFTFVSAPTVTTDIELTYTVEDRNGGTSDTGTVTITYTIDTSSNTAPTATPFTVTNQNSIDFHPSVDDGETVDANLIITFSFVDQSDAATFTIDTDDATLDTTTNVYTLVSNPVKFTSTATTFDVTLNYFVSDSIATPVTSTVQLVRTALALTTPINFEYPYDARSTTFTNTYTDAEFGTLINAVTNGITDSDFDNVDISFTNTNTNHDDVTSDSAISFDSTTNTLSFTPNVDGTTTLPHTITESFTVSFNGREGIASFAFQLIMAECNSSITSGNVDFGRLADAQVSSEGNFMVLNNGNVPHDLSVFAADWLDTADTPPATSVMLVGATAYSTTADTEYDTKTKFTTTAASVITDHPATETSAIYLQLSVDLINSDFIGGTQQTITTTLSCIPA